MKISTSAGQIAWRIRSYGFAGWSSRWRTIYVLPGFEHDQHLLRHERKHLEQIERDGRIWFALKYSWWTIRHGYRSNPYEIEARAAEWKDS